MAPNDGYGGDSDEDDGFDDDVPGGGSGRNDDQPEEENPFTAFAEAHAKAARRRARTPDMDRNHDAAMQEVDLGGGDDTDGNANDLEGTGHDNPFAAYAQQHRNGGGGKGGHNNTTHAGQGGADDYDDDDSTDDDIEDVTPVRSAASKPAPPKYGGSARKKAAGWGGGGASSDDETAVTAITANTTNTRKTKKFAGIGNNRSDVEEDYGTGLFTISDDKEDDENGESDTDEDEPFGNSLVKDMPKRSKMSRMDSKDSAYEDASDDDDGSEGSSAFEDPSPFAKYTGEAEEEDEENPFGKYVSSATRRAARQREDEELMDDLFPEDTAGGRHDGGGGRGGGFGEDDDHDDYDGLDDDDDESPRNAKSKDSGAGTTPTGMISYDQDFEDVDYDLDGLDENYNSIKAYEKRRGMLTNRQWAVVLAIVTCISVLLAIIVGLSVALASSNKKNAGSTKNGGDDKITLGGSIDDGKIPPARPHVVSQSYLQTYSGQDIETIGSTLMIEQYEELMASYLTYYIGGVGEDDTTKLESIKAEDEAGDGDASATLTFIDEDGNIANLPYIEGTDGNKNIEVAEGQTLVFGGNVGGGTRHQRSLVLDMGSVTARCSFNFQRLSSTATRNRRHNSGGGGRRERRQRYRGLRRRRAQVPQEVLDAAKEFDDGTLSITGAAPTFYDGSDGAEGGGEQPLTPNTEPKPTCPPGMEAVRGSNGQVIGCSPSKAPPTSENMPTSAVGSIPERPVDSESALAELTNEMVIIDEQNPPDELDGEAAIATATVLDVMAAKEEDSMHLEIDFTMTWSASRHRSSQGDDGGNKKTEADAKGALDGDEDKVLRELEHFPRHFEVFMNSQRGKRQQLHDLTKVLELDVEAISDVVEREPLRHKFTDVPTVAPTPAPFAATSLQPTPEDGCCFKICLFSC